MPTAVAPPSGGTTLPLAGATYDTAGTPPLPWSREITGEIGIHTRGAGVRLWLRMARRADVAPMDAALEFAELAEQWHDDTDDIASISRAISHAAYLKIINIGTPVLPLILRDLRDSGGFWFPALEAITRVRLGAEAERHSYRLLRALWIRWGEERGLLS